MGRSHERKRRRMSSYVHCKRTQLTWVFQRRCPINFVGSVALNHGSNAGIASGVRDIKVENSATYFGRTQFDCIAPMFSCLRTADVVV